MVTPPPSYTPPTIWPIWVAVAVLYVGLGWLVDRALEHRWPEAVARGTAVVLGEGR